MTEEAFQKKAPALYVIIVFKLLKGSCFLALAFVVYALSDNDLPQEYQNLMNFLKVHPGNQFFSDLAVRVGRLTEANVIWAAVGTLVYSLFSLVEGVGMIFRVGWAGWLAIGESAFFIPIEVFELIHRNSWHVAMVAIINILIVWYLYRNRLRLFHHHHQHSP